MKKILFLSLVILIFHPMITNALLIDPKFSVDPASPAIDGDITPDDVLLTGPTVHTQGTDLNLQDDFFSGLFDNLNALSYGQDPIRETSLSIPLFFSVDRVAVGLSGTDVHDQAQPGFEEAAGDVYKSLPPFENNNIFIDEEYLGLMPGFFGDDLDALELDTEPNPYTYFSIDFLSISNMGDLSDDILFSDGTGSFDIFAEGVTNIGLEFGDDLDALALWDVFEPGILNPGKDLAFFSISTFSPSTYILSGNTYDPAGIKGYLSPADILFTDFQTEFLPGQKFKLWASADDIGLRSDDEVNALDTVPEPATLIYMFLGIVVFLFPGKIGIKKYFIGKSRKV